MRFVKPFKVKSLSKKNDIVCAKSTYVTAIQIITPIYEFTNTSIFNLKKEVITYVKVLFIQF